MEYGYVITCEGAGGRVFTVIDGGFASFDEALGAAYERWIEVEDRWAGCEPFDYYVF